MKLGEDAKESRGTVTNKRKNRCSKIMEKTMQWKEGTQLDGMTMQHNCETKQANETSIISVACATSVVLNQTQSRLKTEEDIVYMQVRQKIVP